MGSEAESEVRAQDPVNGLLIVGLSVQSQGARAGVGGLMVEVVDAPHSDSQAPASLVLATTTFSKSHHLSRSQQNSSKTPNQHLNSIQDFQNDVPRPRASKLAKEHNISAHEEREIREAFSLFAEPLKGYSKEGVIPTSDVRSCLVALGIPPSSRDEQAEFVDILDPEGEGFVAYEPFFAVCALKYHQREERGGGEARRREVEEAFGLFTGAGAGGGSSASGSAGPRDVITIADLKRVAAVLREDVKDEVLRDMILEANGGAGVGKGVRRDEFEEVMRRAGVWR
ncbi:calmodulin [Colletotrichum costaricense]|uniref:Calmodulin n=1 Tax=Colletotrichum costaricense TaxID=1209916 RepID=A0AAJ0E8K9_9PEZI|nr:calmodulin [Colletotrichum costaricense]KAK1539733.1 calmodulin [Colletotrichum costaricense]